MQKLVFATNNQHKVNEFRSILGDSFELVTLKEAGIEIDIPEPHPSIEENAREKSSVIQKLTGLDCFGEDTGLEVDALNGEPGVHSATYAGAEKCFNSNIEKLLLNLQGQANRKARFRTVISLMLNSREYRFEGICNGIIIEYKRGNEGFGYDPVFIPDGATRTFAEMSMEEKNEYSHRKKAVAQLVSFLTNHK